LFFLKSCLLNIPKAPCTAAYSGYTWLPIPKLKTPVQADPCARNTYCHSYERPVFSTPVERTKMIVWYTALKLPSFWVEKRELSYSVGGSINWCSH